jgi:hypothetical protein
MSNQRILFITVGLLCTLCAGSARAGDFIDTRITFTLGDDNFLKNAGEQVPDSAKIGIGDREGYQLFFDNLNSRTTGRENQLDLVLFKRLPGILPGLTTEAAAAVRLNIEEMQAGSPQLKKVLQDDSSYIRLVYAIDRAKTGKKNIDLVLFPLSGDRFRVGYLYALTWGGADMFPRRAGPTPAFKLGGNHGMLYWWAGMKMVRAETAATTSQDEQQQTITTSNLETFYSALAGIGIQPVKGLSIDFNGGHVQMGENPIRDVAGKTVTATGFSARIAYGRGLSVGLSSDLKLLRTDPEFIASLAMRPKYSPGSGFSWSVSGEGNVIAQVLADPDLYGATMRQWATAAAFDFRMQHNYLRFNVTALFRSLEFILLNTPSFVPFQGLPSEAQIQPEFFAALSADYHFPRIGLTPGFQAGVELPAAVKTQLTATTVGSSAPPTLIGEHTIVIRANGRPDILPEGEGRMPLFSFRLNTSWYVSDFLTLVAFAFMTYDQNNTVLKVNADFTKTRVFDSAARFGAGLTAQARF